MSTPRAHALPRVPAARPARLLVWVRRPGAARDALLALVASRALVWLAGVIAFEVAGARDPRVPHIGAVGDALAAPITRWDSIHLEAIALHGYATKSNSAFFPLYPLLARAVGEVTGSLLVGGALVSLVSFFAGLVIVHRLAELELGAAAARRTVWLLAFFPAALFFSAFYTEALFLALTAGAVYLARRGRFGWACALGALASATRNTGVLVAVPIALLYLQERERRVDRDALWLLLVPAGLVAFSIYQWARFGDPLATWHVQTFWSRGFHGPFSAVWYAIPKTWQATYELFTGSHDTFESPIAKLALGGALGLAVVSVVGLFRRLPVAYGAYVVVALLAPLSSPWPAHPLMSLPRFLAVLFPIHMWLALRTAPPRRFAVVFVASGAMLAVLSVKFATWGWAG